MARTEPDAQAVETALGLNRSDYTRMQRALNTLGFNVGVEDGVFGPRSRAGLTRFQRENGQEASGYLTASAVSSLRAVQLPRKAEPVTSSDTNINAPQTNRVDPSQTGLSATVDAERFIGNIYCLRDARGVWDGKGTGDYRTDCLKVKAASGEVITYLHLYQRPRIWRVHKKTITASKSRFVLPSESNAQLRFDGKTYVVSQPLACVSFTTC